MNAQAPEKYGEVVARLKELVESLEGGELSLEESLDKFSEGVQLVKRGEKLLSDAERRIEQLLSEEGKSAPLSMGEIPEPPKGPARRPAVSDEDDIPF